ncbi:MAG: hypothetical protein WBJ37_12030 [Bacteroidales bacterium]
MKLLVYRILSCLKNPAVNSKLLISLNPENYNTSMKDPVSIFITVTVFIIVAIRLYLRYKEKGTSGANKAKSKQDLSSSPQEEEYEPYKNK